ncbi:putative baseplate assembly protein [soil metagenome]
MPLPTPGLDDRTFQDIVDEAKRLIPRYCPEWTNHNVSDPGVALIELFAWMSEMVLFRVNQVPERLYTHFLNMVGIEPFPPSVARADLTFWLSAVRDVATLVPEGTEVTTAAGATGQTTPVVFSTMADLVIEPPRLEGASTLTSGDGTITDVWDDVRVDTRGTLCFPSPTVTPGDAFCLAFEQSLAGMVLRIHVETENPEGIGIDPNDPPLRWQVWNGVDWIDCRVHTDGTGGLNRTGSIDLLVPVEHERHLLGEKTSYWLRAVLIAPRVGQKQYERSPRVRNIAASALGGTARAEHSERVRVEQIGRSDGSPGQQFHAARVPVLPRRDGELVQIVDGDVTTDWVEVEDFSGSDVHDRHFVWDNSTGAVTFGPKVRYRDGSTRQHGALPRDGARVMVTGYRTGGGARGNVGAGTLTAMRSSVMYVRGVTNVQPATGGVDGESVAEAKVRAPLTLRTGQRAVTPGDFERLTREASAEVARARCQSANRGNGAVQLLVVPQVLGSPERHVLDDFAISPALMDDITSRLDRHRLVGTAVEVSTPYYQGVSVAALVTAIPGRSEDLVRARAEEAVSRFINPVVGGLDGTGWPFDADVNVAVITQILESVDGVERVDEALLFEYDLRKKRRLGSAKDVIRLDRQSLFLAAQLKVVVR